MRHSIDSMDLRRQREFSFKTFGPPRGDNPSAGVIDHIKKELKEVEADPKDIKEWADILILAFDGALRQGYDGAAIITAYHEKMDVNRKRKWPDWRTAKPGKAIEHIREEAADPLGR